MNLVWLLFETMKTFVSEAKQEQILAEFSSRSWFVQNEKGTFQLSDEGRLKHQIILGSQKEIRQRALQSISEEEYTTVISGLQRIVENLVEESA